MRAPRWVPDLGIIVDVGAAVAGVALIAAAAWGPENENGIEVHGPAWLRTVLPLLIGAPLVLRRRAPLLMWAIIWAGITLQAAVTLTSMPSHGPELVFVLFVGGYAVGAYGTLRQALAGLAIMAPGAVVYVLTSRAASPTFQFIPVPGAHPPSSAMFFLAEVVICMLAGILVRARADAAALTAEAERTVATERTRIARELHDIVAHHLSVVILQAAGARASGKPAAASLAKIEHSGRQALTELRRLVGVLRDQHDEPQLAPQPGVGELPALADTLRAAGVPVRLVVDSGPMALPAAVDVSAYRIVQEALTNVLKHAGPASADVAVCQADDVVTIEISDDGTGSAATATGGGHGLIGMRERVSLFGGDFHAGPRPGGGFTVRARLPLTGDPS